MNKQMLHLSVIMLLCSLATALPIAAASSRLEANTATESCSICMNAMTPGQVVAVCEHAEQHRFHGECIYQFFNAQAGNPNLCPLCRKIWNLQEEHKHLLFAAEQGHLERVKKSLEAGALVNHKNQYGDTALIVAAINGHANVVERLLAAGAEIDHEGQHKDTALIVAAQRGHVAVVSLLLEAGANVNCKNKHFDTALSYARDPLIIAMLQAAGTVSSSRCCSVQ